MSLQEQCNREANPKYLCYGSAVGAALPSKPKLDVPL